MIRRPILLAVLALATALAAPAAAVQPEPVVETVHPDMDDDLQRGAWVVQLDALSHQGQAGGKLFGMAGGDPAMNGLYTYLAFPGAGSGEWRVFQIGNFLSYRIIREAAGRVLLEIEESTMNEDGVIGSRRRQLELRWSPGQEDTPPETVTVRRLLG